MSAREMKRTDPVLPMQGGRQTQVDPGGGAREEAVRRRAYQLFEKRGRKDGYDLQDWLDAEVLVRAEQIDSELIGIASENGRAAGQFLAK